MHQYSRIEYKRRFLMHELPGEPPWAVRRIVDRYIDGTRIRLRRSQGVVDGKPELALKLTQKIPFADIDSGRQGEITNFYLEPAEYEVLAGLQAAVLTKTRYSFPPLGVDVFEGPLTGLITAEAEFDHEDELLRFRPPPFCVREITGDSRFTGGRLVRLSSEALEELLADRG